MKKHYLYALSVLSSSLNYNCDDQYILKLWYVQVVQHRMVAHLKDAKTMTLSAPIAAIN